MLSYKSVGFRCVYEKDMLDLPVNESLVSFGLQQNEMAPETYSNF